MTQAYEMLKDVETKELVEQERVSRFEDLVSRLSLSDDEQDALEVMETKESWEASYHADPKPLQTNGIHLKQWVGGCPCLHAIQLDCWLSCDRVWACPILSASWDVTVAFVEWPFRECPQWTRTLRDFIRETIPTLGETVVWYDKSLQVLVWIIPILYIYFSCSFKKQGPQPFAMFPVLLDVGPLNVFLVSI